MYLILIQIKYFIIQPDYFIIQPDYFTNQLDYFRLIIKLVVFTKTFTFQQLQKKTD